MRVARAGHPFPLLVHPARGAIYLTSASGPPLGIGEDNFTEQEASFEVGSTLLLYTDGLLERPGIQITASESTLAEIAHASGSHPETLCDNVVRRFLRGRPSEDDVALLAVLYKGLANDQQEGLGASQAEVQATADSRQLAKPGARLTTSWC
jgi:serine phosphatase RsbU (regulator of sigma subunit)